MTTEKKQKALSDWAPQGGLQLGAPLNMAGERTASTAPSQPETGLPIVPLLGGVVLGAVVTAVVFSVAFPSVVPGPIVIVSAAGVVAPVEPVAAAPVVAAPTKPAVAAVAAPKPAAAEKTAVAEKPAAEKGPSVSDAFAKVAVDPSAPDELTNDEISEVAAAHRAATSACVEAHKTAAPDTTGALSVRWNVETEGKVNNVTPLGELAESELATCLVKEISTWVYPKHDTPHPPLTTSFKF
ncbi:MAG: AgmX/PglI C-terminal domain-containing protein [Myxococcaceae bacterium]|nr:AgmX/PglI C-terminal domain-containing protein [Myxococcaceae bacterium]